MKRVLVLGSPGSGKSTFSRKLSKKNGLPIVYLDLLLWNADKTTVNDDTFNQRLDKELVKENWIMDGNYNMTLDRRVARCDTIFLLDYPTEVCLDGIRQRMGKARPDMPWIEEKINPGFMNYIKIYRMKERPKTLGTLADYPNKKIIIFKSRQEANKYLEKIG